MTTSGTYSWSLSLGEAVLHAYFLAGVKPTEIVQEHMQAAHTAANLVLADWANKQVNLWKVELVTQALSAGTTTYTVDPSVMLILDAYIETGSGQTATDRIILPVSRSVYASYPNKSQQGTVATYWFDRLLSPTLSLYLTPDGTQPTLKYYAVQQMQDANYTSGQTVDIPYAWLTAFVYALAVELAVIWNPGRVQLLEPRAANYWAAAANTNVETDNFYFSPQMSGYYR